VFCIEELTIPEPVNLKPMVQLDNPFTYTNASISDFYTNADIYLILNEDFDWGQDDVTKGFYEFHTEKNALRTKILNVNNKEVINGIKTGDVIKLGSVNKEESRINLNIFLVKTKPKKGWKLMSKNSETIRLGTKVPKLNNLSITLPAIKLTEFISR